MQPVPENWHEDFFGGLWLDVQRQSYSEDENADIAETAIGVMQLEPGCRILDMPCGDGRIALEVARRGFEVTGVERHPDLVARARAAAASEEIKIEFLQQSMWDFESERRFAGAMCLWTSFGYGTREQDAAHLAGVARHLDDDGLFLIETHVNESLLHQFEDRTWRWAGDVLVAEERLHDPRTGTLRTDWVLSRGETTERKSSVMQLYNYRELVLLLQAAGLETVEAWGSYDLEPFETGSPICLLLAKKS